MHRSIQQARRTLGYPPRTDRDLLPRSDRIQQLGVRALRLGLRRQGPGSSELPARRCSVDNPRGAPARPAHRAHAQSPRLEPVGRPMEGRR
eukprot:9491394-Pyramimonas_sp.AAC.1